jgi:hypothetical protein
VISWLNDDAKDRREEREERLVSRLQPTWAQELKMYVKEINKSYLKCEALNHYTR